MRARTGRRGAARLAHAVLGSAFAACTEEVPVTQIVVVVDSDLAVPAEIDRATIDVTGRAAYGSATADLTVRPLPRSLGLVHDGGPLGPVTVTARAWLGADPVIERTAVVAFESGRSLFLSLALTRSCVGVPCADATTTCVEGACAPRAIGGLPPFDGTPHAVEVDAPTEGSAASGPITGSSGGVDPSGGTGGAGAGTDAGGAGFTPTDAGRPAGEGTACGSEAECPIDAPWCGPNGCQDGSEGDPCDAPAHCVGPLLCSSRGRCQDGSEGDPCDAPTDCASAQCDSGECV